MLLMVRSPKVRSPKVRGPKVRGPQVRGREVRGREVRRNMDYIPTPEFFVRADTPQRSAAEKERLYAGSRNGLPEARLSPGRR